MTDIPSYLLWRRTYRSGVGMGFRSFLSTLPPVFTIYPLLNSLKSVYTEMVFGNTVLFCFVFFRKRPPSTLRRHLLGSPGKLGHKKVYAGWSKGPTNFHSVKYRVIYTFTTELPVIIQT